MEIFYMRSLIEGNEIISILINIAGVHYFTMIKLLQYVICNIKPFFVKYVKY